MSVSDCPKSIYMGIDPSLRNLGLCLLYSSNGQEQDVVTDCFGYSNKEFDLRGDRLQNIFIRIREHIEDYAKRYKHDHEKVYIVFEHFVMGGKGRICDLAELAGYIKGHIHALMLDDDSLKDLIEIVEIPPKTLKKYITGNGNSNKEAMKEAINHRYGKDFSNDNEADAYALCKMLQELNEKTSVDTTDWLRKIASF